MSEVAPDTAGGAEGVRGEPYRSAGSLANVPPLVIGAGGIAAIGRIDGVDGAALVAYLSTASGLLPSRSDVE
jgi:hypothetical protein